MPNIEETNEISIDTPEGPMRAFHAAPSGTPRGGVLVIHQAGGLSPQVAASVGRFAEAGYLAIGPDFFHRKNLAPDFNPMREFAGDLQRFSLWLEGDPHILADVDTALSWLREHGVAAERLAVVGFSWGGRAAFLAGARQPLAAAVSWYAPGIWHKNFEANTELPALADDVATMRTPWLGLFGEQDGLTPPEELDELAAALQGAPVEAEMVRYPVGHAFDVDMGPNRPPHFPPYDPQSAAQAWERCLGWLTDRL